MGARTLAESGNAQDASVKRPDGAAVGDSSQLNRADTPRLSIQGLCLSYARRIVLDDVSFDVAPGEIFGILGPNGSGKSSLMRALTGLQRFDRGTVWLDGRKVATHDRVLRASVGVVFQEPSLDPYLGALENLVLGAALFGVAAGEARQRAKELLQFMELQDRGADQVRILSGGMRRRLELARALIHKPTLLLLDEPTTGLDPGAFERTWQRLLALRRLQGLTMLLSTHRAGEAERCDRLLVLDRGHVVACDTPSALLRRVAGDVIVVEAEKPVELAQEAVQRLGILGHVHGDAVVFERDEGHAWVPRLVEAFPAGRIRAISLRRPSLADVFFHLTGRPLQRAAGSAGSE